MKNIISAIFVMTIIGACLYAFSPYTPMPENTKVEKLIVDKSDRKLTVYADGKVIRSLSISLGDSPIGHKEQDGDEKTPEGSYVINEKAGLGESGYHKNLGVSYPNQKDKLNASKKGFLPGGAIKIHGIKNGYGFISRFHQWVDWTDGCMAVTNEEMDDLFKHVKIGTPIIINP